MNGARLWGGVVALLYLAGCGVSQPAVQGPDERFGHRPSSGSDADREVVVIDAPADDESYFFYPAPVDTVVVRAAPFDAGADASQRVPVEVLIKGAFPDACTELHAAEQERYGHMLDLDLQMRRPRGAVCATVVRPYRFYLMLEGEYEAGDYTLKVNGAVYTFQVAPPRDDRS